MGRPLYDWVVLYASDRIERVIADNILDALEETSDNGYEAISVIRLGTHNFMEDK